MTSEKTFTQAQLSTLIAAEKRDTEAKTRAKVLQEIADKAAPAPKVTPKADGSMSAADVQTLLSRDRAFTRATTSAGLSDRQLARMEAALVADAPPDVAAWSAAYIEDLGIVKTTAAAPAAHSTATLAEALKPAPAAPAALGVRVDPMTSGGLVDPFSFTDAQISQMDPYTLRAHFEKLTEIGRQQSGAPPRPKTAAQRK